MPGGSPVTRLGQHFLTDDSYLERIAHAADLAVGERVLEIGPGRGHLTRHLVDAGANVTAIELDRRLARQLPDRVRDPDDRLTVRQGDAADEAWPDVDKVVANLPYQVSSPVVTRLLDEDHELSVLTLQKEFADRMTAETGTKHASRLTVKVALAADAEVLFDVPPGAFSPPPEVDSAVVRLVPRDREPARDEELLHELVDRAFQHRRKMLRSSLDDLPEVRDALEDLDLATRRPAKLDPDRWIELADRVHERRTP
jgi:16S rRNA (adenine1518-N6/adenine1519-N6)-dimethyltransferase